MTEPVISSYLPLEEADFTTYDQDDNGWIIPTEIKHASDPKTFACRLAVTPLTNTASSKFTNAFNLTTKQLLFNTFTAFKQSNSPEHTFYQANKARIDDLIREFNPWEATTNPTVELRTLSHQTSDGEATTSTTLAIGFMTDPLGYRHDLFGNPCSIQLNPDLFVNTILSDPNTPKTLGLFGMTLGRCALLDEQLTLSANVLGAGNLGADVPSGELVLQRLNQASGTFDTDEYQFDLNAYTQTEAYKPYPNEAGASSDESYIYAAATDKVNAKSPTNQYRTAFFEDYRWKNISSGATDQGLQSGVGIKFILNDPQSQTTLFAFAGWQQQAQSVFGLSTEINGFYGEGRAKRTLKMGDAGATALTLSAITALTANDSTLQPTSTLSLNLKSPNIAGVATALSVSGTWTGQIEDSALTQQEKTITATSSLSAPLTEKLSLKLIGNSKFYQLSTMDGDAITSTTTLTPSLLFTPKNTKGLRPEQCSFSTSLTSKTASRADRFTSDFSTTTALSCEKTF